MIKEQWQQVLDGTEVRQNISKIRQEIKNKSVFNEFLKLIEGREDSIITLLESEDAKTRKNSALLLGDLGIQSALTPLWEAYQKESQRFIKSSYLAALGSLDYRGYTKDIKQQLEQLRKAEVTPENQKHITEEIRELSALIVRMEGVKAHQFTGWDETYDIVLLTNRNFRETTRDELLEKVPGANTKLLGAGVLARVDNLNWLRDIRTYQELLFVVRGMETCPMKPDAVAETIIKSRLFQFLSKSHDGKAPYYFRLEMKTKKDLSLKSAFLKKLSSKIEALSDRRLINTTNHYEFEIRLIENKLGDCNLMIKLFTLKDDRFTYRIDVISASIKPVNAALTAVLAKEFVKEDAQVLDPFCGVGTMLIERHKAVRANTTYGIDIQGDAIEKARINTETAGQIIHYINRDFFQFQHEYLFDEIITNMPFKIGRVAEDEIFELYQQFFKKIPSLLKDGAVVILYTHNRDFVKPLASRTGFKLLKEYEISKKEGTYVVILKKER